MVTIRCDSSAEEKRDHVIEYGVYDVSANTGFVNVGTDHNTAALEL